MDLLRIYQSFCDATRLRIMHLLTRGPLCVCHFQAVLGEPQVKVSKHLAYLKNKELVDVQRHQNWMIYRLPVKSTPELDKNLACLKVCAESEAVLKKDLQKLESLKLDVDWIPAALSCCDKPSKARATKPSRREAKS
jgi:ArsR family transcriptional regulator, arsenate/arsenite/antimonite-responsive transcriptional repressor